jgi:hypothetical protein
MEHIDSSHAELIYCTLISKVNAISLYIDIRYTDLLSEAYIEEEGFLVYKWFSACELDHSVPGFLYRKKHSKDFLISTNRFAEPSSIILETKSTTFVATFRKFNDDR